MHALVPVAQLTAVAGAMHRRALLGFGISGGVLVVIGLDVQRHRSCQGCGARVAVADMLFVQ